MYYSVLALLVALVVAMPVSLLTGKFYQLSFWVYVSLTVFPHVLVLVPVTFAEVCP